MKKWLILGAVALAALCVYLLVPGKEKTKLSMILAMHMLEPQTIAFEKIAAEYGKQKEGVEVEIMPLGAETEAVLKAKMAANELCDLWNTHGWSYLRYREYLEPMQTQPWAKDVSPLIQPAIQGPKGDFYVLPMDIEISGLAINLDVLEKAGVNPDDIITWADLDVALDKIKKSGVTPIAVGGKDIHPLGYLALWLGQSLLVADPAAKGAFDGLVNGVFPREKWREAINILHDYFKKGYMNKDAVTASQTESIQQFARGNAGFLLFASNTGATEAASYNPDGRFGFIPIPAAHRGAVMSLMTGERAAIGIWKDSKHKAAAIDFLQFLARPENIHAVASAGGNPAGLVNATSDTGILKPYYEKYSNVTTFPIFDRAYLPSGMWDTLCTVGVAIISETMTVDEALTKTETEFNRLYHQ